MKKTNSEEKKRSKIDEYTSRIKIKNDLELVEHNKVEKEQRVNYSRKHSTPTRKRNWSRYLISTRRNGKMDLRSNKKVALCNPNLRIVWNFISQSTQIGWTIFSSRSGSLKNIYIVGSWSKTISQLFMEQFLVSKVIIL